MVLWRPCEYAHDEISLKSALPGENTGPSFNKHIWFTFFFLILYLFLTFFFFNLFLAALGIRCCARSFSSWGEQELLLVTVLLIAVASLVAEHGL